MGPAALRTAGLSGALRQLGHDVEDGGDLRIDVGPRGANALSGGERRDANWSELATWTSLLSTAVYDTLQADRVPIVLGGDHSLSLGSIDGVSRHCRAAGRPLFVLWLDAHADFNTPATSRSGNLHGMPLAALCGEPGLEAVLDPGAGPRLDPARVSMIGTRSIDEDELALVEARHIDVVDMRAIDEFGVVAPLRRFLQRVAAAHGFLHVSFDVDVLDPALAPGVGTAVPGGITYREAHLIMEVLHESGLVGSLDLVELNPFLDERGRSALVLVDMAASLFGRRVVAREPARASLAVP